MGFFGRGSPHQEPTEMPPTGDCPHKHRSPGPHWSNSPRHHCPEYVNHGPPEQAFRTESKCPLSRHRRHFKDREFQNSEEFWRQHGFGPHDRPPFFGHHHHHHHHGPPRDFDPRAVNFHGCPFSRWRNHEFKPVFDRRLWE